jgi:hypothetical protein
MGYLYALVNKKNNKKFIGKTNLEEKVLKQFLYRALDDNKHYNKLLQKDWFRYNFEFYTIESDDCIEDFDRLINNEELLNPKNGYNVFNDLQNKKGRHKKTKVYTEDICLLYCFHEDVQFWVKILGLERNTISNRLGNFDLFNNDYFHRAIARYDDYYWTALRILYLDEVCLTADQLMDRMLNRYDVSGQLRVTPRKISKFFSIHGVGSKDKKQKGCLVFCPHCDKDEDE